MTTLSDRFAELFAERPDVKPADLARACRIKQPSVSGWMTGKAKQMEATNAMRAAAFFGVHTWWLATGEGPKRIQDGEADLHRPTTTAGAGGWPFAAAFEDYGALAQADKRALDRVVTGFLTGDAAPNNTAKDK